MNRVGASIARVAGCLALVVVSTGTVGAGLSGGVRAPIKPKAEPARQSGYSVLWPFSADPMGPVYPVGGVFVDDSNDVFGTSTGGGSFDDGAVFELVPAGRYYSGHPIHSFSCAVDGCGPQGTPLEDGSGNLYVTASSANTEFGIAGSTTQSSGAAIELSPSGSGYLETALHPFGNNGDGANPIGGFLSHKRLFVLTENGGAHGQGAIVALDPNTLHGNDVYDFQGGTVDGANPLGTLAVGPDGALYGTTNAGGTYQGGTVFRFVPVGHGGIETVVYDFGRSGDGAGPRSGVAVDAAGNLYGTTAGGGSARYGAVFRLTPGSGGFTESLLHSFGGGADGQQPFGSVTLLRGMLFGTTSAGGSTCGTLFEVAPDGSQYQIKYTFSISAGCNPEDTLVAKGHALYGTALDGGQYQVGVVFRFIP